METTRESELEPVQEVAAVPDAVATPAAMPARPFSAAGVMALQRLVGNAAVAGMIAGQQGEQEKDPGGIGGIVAGAAGAASQLAGGVGAGVAEVAERGQAERMFGPGEDEKAPGGIGGIVAGAAGAASQLAGGVGAGVAEVAERGQAERMCGPGEEEKAGPEATAAGAAGAAASTAAEVAATGGAAAAGGEQAAGIGAAAGTIGAGVAQAAGAGAAGSGIGAGVAQAGAAAAGAAGAGAARPAAAGAAAAGAAAGGAASSSGAAPGARAASAGAAGAAGAAAAPQQAAAGGGASGGAAAGAAAPAPKREPSEDPNFQSMKGKAGAAGSKAKAHQPAAAGAASAQAAAVPPGNEVASQAAGAQVEEMGAQQPGTFDRKAFIAAVQKAIDAAAPKNLEEADDFKGSGKTAQVKGEVGALVKGGKKDAEKDIKSATDAPPDTSKATPKQVTPLQPEEPGSATASVGATGAMPGPRPDEETDLSAGPAEVEQEMDREGVTEEQLAKSNEPDFTTALDARQEAKEHSAKAPEAYRAQEGEILAQGRDEAQQVEEKDLSGMHGSKVAALAKVVGHKGEAKSQDETKRAQVAADIQGIYDKTKTETTEILTGLDGKVDSAFTSGEEQARKQFEDYVGAKMDAYKDDRYSGFFGGARWLKDKLFGMPSEVNAFYSDGRVAYLSAMDGVIGQVADIVGGELNRARLRIAQGRADVRTYVSKLPADLQQVGKDAESKLDDQFDQLSSEVDNKQDALVDSLAQKYVQSRDALDSRIEEMKAANRGLVAKALDAVVGVVKTILKLKDMLLGVLSKAADVIGDIISDPIGFLGRLVDGVKSGLSRFVDNIATHLENGLMGWLFGALGDAGIQMPKTFDLAGIFELVMDVLGLTYRNIRGKVAKLLGEPLVEKMEQTVDVFKTLATKGVAGLWEWIKDKVGDFQEMVLGGIKTFIIERVIKGGITWLLSLLNPAAAFIKACKAIYDIVMFIIERGQAIMEFVNSILDSIGAIARGQIGIVADKVEGALAKALPLAISFLASLLGLGGISDKIREGIEMVRKPIQKAVDFVVMGAVKGFQKVFGGAIGWVKGKYEKGKAWATEKATAAKEWGAGKVRGIKDRLTGGGKDDEAEGQETEHGEEASDEVKDDAGREVEKRAPGTLASHEALDEVVGGVLTDYRPKGLKELRAVQHEGAPGTYDILARATKKVGTARAFDPLGKDYHDPTDPAISADMAAAGVTDFGPYVWDSKVPRWKLEEKALNPHFTGWKLADCVDKPIYDAETKDVKDDKSVAATMIAMRRAAAMRALFGQAKGIIEKLIAHDEGKTPRPFVSLAAEDAACGGHSAERHILGQGDMPTHREVALRAAFWRVNGKLMKLDDAGIASVFASEGAATAAVKAAVASLEPNWEAHMATLAKGTQLKLTVPGAVPAVAYEKVDSPKGAPYDENLDMPTYIDGSKPGKRELYTGDFKGDPKAADAPDPAKNALTTGGATVHGNVYIIIDPSQSYTDGWAIYTAYPKP